MMLVLTFAAAMVQTAPEPPPRPAPPVPQAVADQVWLIPGALTPGRQPDGNTVVFGSARGLTVLDTGRHDWHRQAILDFLAADGRPLTAVVNSHWHLDHISGNLALKAAHPDALVYASNAIDNAIDDFLRPGVIEGRRFLDSGQAPASLAEDILNDMATVAQAERFRPDRALTADGSLPGGDGRLIVRLAPHAATEADAWLFDTVSGVAAAGDLVTLPAPFLDTACPEGWITALSAVAATPFTLVIPGHGRPMDRIGFERYRTAFSRLIDCGRSGATAQACAEAWDRDLGDLLIDGREHRIAVGMTAQYVEVLRAAGGRSRFCRAA